MSVGWQYVIVVFFAGSVGLAELVTRYRSNPGYMLTHSLAATTYIVLNGASGAGALALIRAFGWFSTTDHTDLWRVLIAGFGALAFFRSSLFVTKVGNTDVNVGPSVVLGSLLDACDRAVDRKSAIEIATAVSSDHMADLDPNKVNFSLPVLCLALMQNFAPGDQAQLGAELSKIRGDTTISSETQMRAVVIQLSKYLGADLVGKVLTATRSIMIVDGKPSTAAPVVPSSSDVNQAVIDQAKKLTVPDAEVAPQPLAEPQPAEEPPPPADQPPPPADAPEAPQG